MAFKAISKTINNPLIKKVANNIKQPITKAIGNTVKKSAFMFHQQKNTMKNLACGIGEMCSRTKHAINSPVKYLGEEGVKKFKYLAPWTTRGAKRLVRAESKKSI